MCTNYDAIRYRNFRRFFGIDPPVGEWRDEIYNDYPAPIIRGGADGREALLATFGLVPKAKAPAGRRYATMNARAETVGQLVTYRGAWKGARLCLIPAEAIFEPNWETGKHIRWRIGLASGDPLAVAGLWREWPEPDGPSSYSFTMLTVNATGHPVMEHLHRPGDEKRSVVIIRPEDYDEWLECRDPEFARSFLSLYPAEQLAAGPSPKEKQPAPDLLTPADPEGGE